MWVASRRVVVTIYAGGAPPDSFGSGGIGKPMSAYSSCARQTQRESRRSTKPVNSHRLVITSDHLHPVLCVVDRVRVRLDERDTDRVRDGFAALRGHLGAHVDADGHLRAEAE